jgi:hypothetical protein
MCQCDCLQLQLVFVDRLDYAVGFFTGIDADGEMGRLARNYSSVLLKGGDSNLFNNHS